MNKTKQAVKIQTLSDILSRPNITIQQLTTVNNILNKIRYSFDAFVKYCLIDPLRAHSLIDLGIKTVEFQNTSSKHVSHICNQILCGDHEGVVQLFMILQHQNQQHYHNDDECQVVTEELFQQRENQFNYKYQHLLYLLHDIEKAHPISLNYIGKLLSMIISVNIQDLLELFLKKQQNLSSLIKVAVTNQTISETLAKLVGEQTKIKKYTQLKANIIEIMLSKLKDNHQNILQFQNILVFFDIILTKNKYRADQILQLSIISQKIVFRKTIDFYLTAILQQCPNIAIFSNAINFTLMIVNRMNVDQQVDPYYSRFNPDYQQKPTMDFQVQKIYESYIELVLLKVSDVYRNNKNIMMTYYQLLYKITLNSRWKEINTIPIKPLINLFRIFKQNSTKGIILFYITELITIVIDKIQKFDGKDLVKIVSVLNLHQHPFLQQHQPFLYKVIVLLIKKYQPFAKHFQQMNLFKKIKEYKINLSCQEDFTKIHKSKELLFLNDFQLQQNHKLDLHECKKHKRNMMTLCQNVIENTTIYPESASIPEYTNVGKAQDWQEGDSESEDELICWRQGLPIQKYYISHIYIF